MARGRELQPQVILGIEVEQPVSRTTRVVQKAADVFRHVSDNVPRPQRSPDSSHRFVMQSPRVQRIQHALEFERTIANSEPHDTTVFKGTASRK